jgi:hypothetical protein
MDSRQQLLKTLMGDLEAMKLPERYSAEKQAEIMRGRKGQADIDKGRETIRENERLVQEAETKRDKLSERIQKLQGEIDTATTKAKQDDPTNQAIQYGKSLGVPAAGYAAGHAVGAKFGRAFDMPPDERKAGVKSLADQLRGINKTAPSAKAQASAVVSTYDDRFKRGRGAAQFLAPAALAASSVATQKGAEYVDDPYLKEGLGLAANAERYGAAGMALQQTIDTLRGSAEARRAVDPTDVASIESARRQINAGGKFDKVQGALAAPEPPAPAPAPKPAPTPGKPPTRPQLLEQAKAMGLKVNTRTKKAELEDALAKALRASARRVKDAPKALVPIAAGAGVYDALRSPAEAATTAEPIASRGEAAAAGAGAAAATGGLMAGARAVGNRMMQSPTLSTLLRGAGRVAGPAAGALTAYDVGNMAVEENAKPDQLLEGAREGQMPQTPGNPGFMGDQQRLARQAYGQAEAAPQVTEDDFTPVLAAAEQDPELAEELRQIILARLAEVEEAQDSQIPYALASQEVAGRDPMADALRSFAGR